MLKMSHIVCFQSLRREYLCILNHCMLITCVGVWTARATHAKLINGLIDNGNNHCCSLQQRCLQTEREEGALWEMWPSLPLVLSFHNNNYSKAV